MTRFEHLEFDDGAHKAQPQDAAAGMPVRGALTFQGEADAAYRVWDFEPALRAYSRALEDDHKRIPCWVGQLRALNELGEHKEALMWAHRALELFPDHPQLLAEQAVAAVRSGMTSLALAHSDNAMQQEGVTAGVWVARGEVLIAARKRLAEHCFAQAIALAATPEMQAWTRVEIARVLLRYRRAAQAVRYAEAAVETLPGEPGTWLMLGACQAALGLKKTPEALQRALELRPDCQAARQLLRKFKPRGLFSRLFGG